MIIIKQDIPKIQLTNTALKYKLRVDNIMNSCKLSHETATSIINKLDSFMCDFNYSTLTIAAAPIRGRYIICGNEMEYHTLNYLIGNKKINDPVEFLYKIIKRLIELDILVYKELPELETNYAKQVLYTKLKGNKNE